VWDLIAAGAQAGLWHHCWLLCLCIRRLSTSNLFGAVSRHSVLRSVSFPSLSSQACWSCPSSPSSERRPWRPPALAALRLSAVSCLLRCCVVLRVCLSTASSGRVSAWRRLTLALPFSGFCDSTRCSPGADVVLACSAFLLCCSSFRCFPYRASSRGGVSSSLRRPILFAAPRVASGLLVCDTAWPLRCRLVLPLVHCQSWRSGRVCLLVSRWVRVGYVVVWSGSHSAPVGLLFAVPLRYLLPPRGCCSARFCPCVCLPYLVGSTPWLRATTLWLSVRVCLCTPSEFVRSVVLSIYFDVRCVVWSRSLCVPSLCSCLHWSLFSDARALSASGLRADDLLTLIACISGARLRSVWVSWCRGTVASARPFRCVVCCRSTFSLSCPVSALVFLSFWLLCSLYGWAFAP